MMSHKNVLLTTLGVVFLGASGLLAAESAKPADIASEKAEVAQLREKLATMSKNDQLSPLFNTVARAVRPSVVVIRVTKKIKVNSRSFMFPGFDNLPPDIEEELRKRFGENHPLLQRRRSREKQKERFYRRQGQGSGVIVDAEKGYILTNNHVVADADEANVILADKREFEAEWIRRDPRTDLAVVKIKADDLIASPLGDSDDVKVGHWVLAIGAPFRLEQTVTSGIISAKGRANLVPGDRPMDANKLYQDFIQTDAAINRGNSGGPLVNMRGEVIGINSMIASASGAYDGVGFAIPSNMAKGIMKQLIHNGKVRRGFLGVGIQDVSQEYAEFLGMEKPKGGLISMIQPDSAAAKAGLELEDVITAVNDKELKNANDLKNTIATFAPGQTVALTVLRNGKTMTIKAVLEKNPDDEATAASSTEPEEKESEPESIQALAGLGLTVETLDAELAKQLGYKEDVQGVLIVTVEEDSQAWDKQLRRGMVITNVGKKPVKNIDELVAALKDAKRGYPLRVISPRGGAYFVILKPKAE